MAALSAAEPDRVWEVVSHLPRDRNTLIHFGSLWVGALLLPKVPAGRSVVQTIFHGDPDDPVFRDAFATVKRHRHRIDKIVLSCRTMERRLLVDGWSAEQLCVVPLGVDLSAFRPTDQVEKARRRAEIGLPPDCFCVGSFQKDGSGWGDGDEPKLIKGPDVLVAALAGLQDRLAGRQGLHVLLTGPSRGYVMKRLREIGIPFSHAFLDDADALSGYYQALDAYIIPAREEGGPKSMLEAWASGIPVVSTGVGMALDHLVDDENGLLCPVGDDVALARGLARLWKDPTLGGKLAQAGLEAAKGFDWRNIALRYRTEVYGKLSRSR
ncbi:MAG: glycosyltransferase family 4 protein [Rhodospirillales bacterium]